MPLLMRRAFRSLVRTLMLLAVGGLATTSAASTPTRPSHRGLCALPGGEGFEYRSLGETTPGFHAAVAAEPAGALQIFDSAARPAIRMTPLFRAIGSAEQEGDSLGYRLESDGWLTYDFSASGVKETIRLSEPQEGPLTYRYTLELDPMLRAELGPTGAIEIRQPDAMGASALYTFPAPVILDGDGRTHLDLARFILEPGVIVVEVADLRHLRFPVAIDPSIVVTTTAEFRAGNDQGMISFEVDAIRRDTPSGGALVSSWTSATGFPSNRQAPAAATYGGFLYVLGGYTGSSHLNTVVFAPINADGTVGTWLSASAFPTGRREHAVVAWNGCLYVIGGYNGSSVLSDVRYARILADGSLGAWNAATSLPSARMAHAAVAWDGHLYVLGGWNGSALSEVLVAPLRADGTVGPWVVSTALGTAVWGHAAVASAGRVYVLGGYTGAAYRNQVDFSIIGANGSLSGWIPTTAFPTTRNYFSALAHDGHLYVLGGNNGALTSSVAFAAMNADGTIGGWSSTTSLLTARGYFAAATYADRIYVLGGYDGSRRNYVEFAAVRPVGVVRAWTATTSLPSARYGHTSVEYDGFLYSLGGFIGSASSDVRSAAISIDGSIGSWSATSGLTTARAHHSSVAYNGYLYVLGGTNGGLLADVEFAPVQSSGTLGAFVSTTPLPSERAFHGSVAYNGYLYVLGGLTAGGYVAEVWRAPIASDGSLGVWTATSSFSMGRGNPVTFASGGFLYLIGGYDGISLGDVQYAPIFADGSIGAWSPTTGFLGPRHDHAGFVHGGFIYLLGGIADGVDLSDVQYAPIAGDGSVGAWQSTSAFTTPRRYHAALARNGIAYLLGGIGSSGALADVQRVALAPSGPVGAWTSTTALTAPRLNHSAVVAKGRLYVMGGYNGGGDLHDAAHAPIGATGTIGPFVATNAPSQPGAIVVAHGDHLYAVGGGLSANVDFTTVNADGSLAPWTPTTSFGGGRVDPGAVAYRGYLYVLGGFDGSHRLDVQYAPIAADGSVGSFTATTSLTFARASLAAVAYDGYLYVIGGDNGVSLDIVESAPIQPDGSLGSWTRTTGFHGPRSAHSAVAWNGFLYVLFGWAPVAPGARGEVVQYAPIGENGQLGPWTFSTDLSIATFSSAAAVANGILYVTGGARTADSVPLEQVVFATLQGPAARGRYSKLFDFGADSVVAGIEFASTAGNLGEADLSWMSASSAGGIFGAKSDEPNAKPGVVHDFGVGCARYLWLGFELDDTASATTTEAWTSGRSDLLDVTVSYDEMAATGAGPYCAGETVVLSATTVPGAAYSWTGPNGFASTSPNPTIPNASPGASGAYTVTATSGTCVLQDSVGVTVNPLPSATITTGDSPILCSGGSILLTASSGAGHQWYRNGDLIDGATGSTFTASMAGGYTVRVTSPQGCTKTSTTFAVADSPVPTVANDGPVCAGGRLRLTAAGGGDQAWVARTAFSADESLAAMTVDGRGDIYLAASIAGSPDGDLLVVRLSADGSPASAWPDLGQGVGVRRYDGGNGHDERAAAIDVDANGTVRVAGTAYVEEVAGTWRGDDMFVVAYDEEGNLLATWPDIGSGTGVRRYEGLPGLPNWTTAMVVDDGGNSLVTGFSDSPGSGFDILTFKLDVNGHFSADWPDLGAGIGVRRYDGAANSADDPAAMALGPSGELYVTGSASSAGGDYDIVTIRYEADGSPSSAWPDVGAGVGVRSYDGPAGGSDRAAALAVDPVGGVVVTGRSEGSGTQADFVTLRYGADGAPSASWPDVGAGAGIRRYDGSASGHDVARAIGVFGTGDVVVTGESTVVGSDRDFTTIRYASDGSLAAAWPDLGAGVGIRRYGFSGGSSDMATAIAIDALGRVYVTGSSSSATNADFATIRYEADGTPSPLWPDVGFGPGVRRYNGPGNSYDWPNAMVLDASGGLLVAGSSSGSTGNDDIAVIKFGATFAWSGPNGFTSDEPSPVIENFGVAMAGQYTATVTAYGCTSPATTTVIVSGEVADSVGDSLRTTKAGAQPALSWSLANLALSYDVRRCDSGAGPCLPLLVTNTADPDWADGAAPPNAWYSIEAVNACGATP